MTISELLSSFAEGSVFEFFMMRKDPDGMYHYKHVAAKIEDSLRKTFEDNPQFTLRPNKFPVPKQIPSVQTELHVITDAADYQIDEESTLPIGLIEVSEEYAEPFDDDYVKRTES